MKPEQAQGQLDTLRKDRSLPTRDLSLGFMQEQFKREVAKPYRQLGGLAELWRELLPAHLVQRSKLVGLSRGVLHVEADSPAAHFAIDQHLRGGVMRELIARHRGPAIRRVQVRLGTRAATESDDPLRRPPAEDADEKLSPEVQPARGRRRPDD
jgi:hypothetical protein